MYLQRQRELKREFNEFFIYSQKAACAAVKLMSYMIGDILAFGFSLMRFMLLGGKMIRRHEPGKYEEVNFREHYEHIRMF